MQRVILLAVFPWRATGAFQKRRVETADRPEAGVERDAEDLLVGGRQQALRVGNAVLREIVDQGRAEGSLEHRHRIVRMNADVPGHGLHRQGLGIVQGDECRIRAYVGEGALPDDELHTFGTRAVARIPKLQKLMRYVCANGFEHHVVMNLSHTAAVLTEAFRTYLGWETHHHECPQD